MSGKVTAGPWAAAGERSATGRRGLRHAPRARASSCHYAHTTALSRARAKKASRRGPAPPNARIPSPLRAPTCPTDVGASHRRVRRGRRRACCRRGPEGHPARAIGHASLRSPRAAGGRVRPPARQQVREWAQAQGRRGPSSRIERQCPRPDRQVSPQGRRMWCRAAPPRRRRHRPPTFASLRPYSATITDKILSIREAR